MQVGLFHLLYTVLCGVWSLVSLIVPYSLTYHGSNLMYRFRYRCQECFHQLFQKTKGLNMAGKKVGPLAKKVRGFKSMVGSCIAKEISFKRSLSKSCKDLDLSCGLITKFVSFAYFPIKGNHLNRVIHLIKNS